MSQIAEFIVRCLRGEHRGESGRDRINLPSRLWVVFRDYEGISYEEPLVVNTFGLCKDRVKRGSGPDFGESVFVGLPSQREVDHLLRRVAALKAARARRAFSLCLRKESLSLILTSSCTTLHLVW